MVVWRRRKTHKQRDRCSSTAALPSEWQWGMQLQLSMTSHFPDRDLLKKGQEISTYFMCQKLITCMDNGDSSTASSPTRSILCDSHTHLTCTIHMHGNKNTNTNTQALSIWTTQKYSNVILNHEREGRLAWLKYTRVISRDSFSVWVE